MQCEYQVYVACSQNDEDQKKAQKIVNYLKENGVHEIMEDDTVGPGYKFSDKLIAASKSCRWLIFLQTKDALQDTTLTFNVMSALAYSICKKKSKSYTSCKQMWHPSHSRNFKMGDLHSIWRQR